MSESNRRRLFELLKIPGNNICADCDQEGIHYLPQIFTALSILLIM
jgi:hypothetical protein